jgi:hypothetical protein
METKTVTGKVVWMTLSGMKGLYLDHPPEHAGAVQMATPLSGGAFPLMPVEELFKPYLGKSISVTFELTAGKVHRITIEEE